MLVAAAALVAVLVIAVRSRQFVTRWLPFAILIPQAVITPVHGLHRYTPATLLMAVAAFAVLQQPDRDRPTLPRPVVRAFCCYTALVVYLQISRTVPHGLDHTLAMTLSWILPLWLVAAAVRTRLDVERIVGATVAAMTVAALAALYEYATGRFLLPAAFHAGSRGGAIRIQGLWPHPIIFGVAVAVTLPLAVARLQNVPRLRKGRYRFAVAALGLALLLSVSRGAWTAAVVAFLAMAMIGSREMRRRIVRFGVVALIVLMVSPYGRTARSTVSESFGGGNTSLLSENVAYRVALTKLAVGYGEHHALGAGAGASEHMTLPGILYGQSLDFAHSIDNTYAIWLLDLGWLGLLAVAGLFLVVVRTSVAVARRAAPDPTLGPIAAAIAAGQIGLLVAAFTVSTFASWPQLVLLFWMLAGTQYAIGRLAISDQPAEAPHER